MITVSDLAKNFSPDAEIKVHTNEGSLDVVDIGWKDSLKDKDILTLKDIEIRKAQASTIYLVTDKPVIKDAQSSYVPSNSTFAKNLFEELPYKDCDKCILDCKFKVKRIVKKNSLVKALNIKVGDVISVSMPLERKSNGRVPKAQYVTIYNVCTDTKIVYSINRVANMINKDLKIYRI